MGGGSAIPIVALCLAEPTRATKSPRVSLSPRAPSSLPLPLLGSLVPLVRSERVSVCVCVHAWPALSLHRPPLPCRAHHHHHYCSLAYSHTSYIHPSAACHPLLSTIHDSHSAASSSHTPCSPHRPPHHQLLTHSPPAHTRKRALIRQAQHSETPPAANPDVPHAACPLARRLHTQQPARL